MEQTESGEYIVNLESSDENIDSEIMENNNIGGQELAILLGFLFIIYGVLDFLISNLWITLPGGALSPVIFGLLGSALIRFSAYFNFLEFSFFFFIFSNYFKCWVDILISNKKGVI